MMTPAERLAAARAAEEHFVRLSPAEQIAAQVALVREGVLVALPLPTNPRAYDTGLRR